MSSPPSGAPPRRLSSEVYDRAGSLESAANNVISGTLNSALDRRVASSTNAVAVTASARAGATLGSHTFTVSQVAVAQQNTGTALDPAAATALVTGTHSFSLTIGGTTHNLSVTVNAGDSNQQVLDRMAAAINNAKAGATSAVVKNANGTASLQVTADRTGTSGAFTLADTAGGAVANTGAGTATRAAENASYTQDGISRTSETNAFSLDQGRLQVTLLAPSTQPVTAKVSPDAPGLASAVEGLANAINQTFSTVRQNAARLSSALVPALQAAGQDAKLKQIGIDRQADGALTVDKNELTDAVQKDFAGVKDALSGPSGLATEAHAFAREIRTQPLNRIAANAPLMPPQSSAWHAYVRFQRQGLLLDQLMGGGFSFDQIF